MTLNEKIVDTILENIMAYSEPGGGVWFDIDKVKEAANSIENLVLKEIEKAFEAGEKILGNDFVRKEDYIKNILK